MIEKIEKNRKLHGTVLLTVVMVMSLLIIFLFSTLTLATAANNRAHVNYSTAQTQVTSRTVVDAAIKAMELDSDYAKAIGDIEINGEMKVPVALGSTVSNSGRYGDIDAVLVTYEGSKRFYNDVADEWTDGDIIKFSSTVSMAGVDTTTAAYIVKQKPKHSTSAGGNGAGFVTTASANLACQTNLYGGSYINLPELKFDNVTNKYYSTDDSGATYTYDYKNPATYRNFPAYSAGDSSTYFNLYNSNAFAEADLYVNNNMFIENWSGFIFPGEGTGITIWGDLIYNASNLKILGNGFDSTTDINFNKLPYIYVDGAFKFTNRTHFNVNTDNKLPLNVFCGYFDATGASNGLTMNADIYCMDDDKTSYFTFNSTSNLEAWVSSVVNKCDPIEPTSKLHGSIYSAGNADFKNFTVPGDVRIAGNCKIEGNVNITGDLVVGGELKIESGATLKVTGDIYCDNLVNNGNLSKEPNYKSVNTFEHEPDTTGAETVNSVRRKYLRFEVTERHGDDYIGIFGEKIYSHNKEVKEIYYKWKEDFDPSVFGIKEDEDYKYTDAQTFFDETGGWDVRNFLDSTKLDDWGNVKNEEQINFDYMSYPYAVADGADKRPHNHGSNEGYLVETEIDSDGTIHAQSVPTDEESFIVDPVTKEKYTNYFTVPNFDGSDSLDKVSDLDDSLGYPDDTAVVWYNKKTEEIVSKDEGESGALGYSALKLDKYIDENVYPEYAKKLVILGEEELDDDVIENTKIVMRMEDVVQNVANPYDFKNLSGTLQSQYNVIHNDSPTGEPNDATYFTNDTKILDTVGNYAQYASTDSKTKHGSYTPTSTSDIKNVDGNYIKGFSNYHHDGKALYIDRSCVINMSGVSSDIVINPQAGNIIVVIEHLDMASGCGILIDDSQGGTVNFFIEPERGDGVFSMADGLITTLTYERAFIANRGKVWYYNSPSFASDANAFNLASLGKPKLNIYGTDGTTLNLSNMNYIVANILSPNLEVNVYSTDNKSISYDFSEMYYNGVNIKKPDGSTSSDFAQYIFGCLNSHNTSIPNEINVLYVADSSSTPSIVGDGDDKFEYRVMYYDEY